MSPAYSLHTAKPNNINIAGLKKLSFEYGNPITGKIEYNSGEFFQTSIAHQSVHNSGEAHIKLIDNSYVEKTFGVPLGDLEIPRPLWTVVPASFTCK